MLLVFEDRSWQNFVPLTYTRPVFDLRCGAFTLRERIAALLATLPPMQPGDVAATTARTPPNATMPLAPATIQVNRGTDEMTLFGLSRPHLMPYYGPQHGISSVLSESKPLTLVNGRALTLDWLPDLLRAPVGTVYASQQTLLGARLSPALASIALYYLRDQNATDALEELERFTYVRDVEATLLTYPWELVTQAGEQLLRDSDLLSARLPAYTPTDSQVVVHNPNHVFVAPSAQLDGPLVLDARDGPICVDEGAHIEPFSFIQGPAYIGSRALISSALIRGETSIGPVCRIGGEVEASTVQAFTNKHHEGFLGHSWLGEWVNIGAMTTTSDLKNTYGNIKVTTEYLGQVDSGTIKLGCFLADHVKLGIGLHLTGGAVIGTGSNIFSIHSVPKTVPAFTWGSEVFYEYRIERMISVARKVMSRRKQLLTEEYEAMLRAVFSMTRSHRDAADTLIIQPSAASAAAADAPELLVRAETAAVEA